MEMIGKGYKGLDTVLGHLDIPSMSHRTFDTTARFIGSYVKTVSNESMNKAQVEERKKLEVTGSLMDAQNNYIGEGITDAGWQKRAYNHNCNSLSGVGVLIGKQTGKILDSEVLTINCKICTIAKQKGTSVQLHDCTALWQKSAKAMEPEMAVRMWNRSGDYGIHFDVQIGDEDSTTQNRLQKDVSSTLQPTIKKSDFLHIKRNFSNHLFKLKPKYKKILSKAVIFKLSSDFGAALKTNIGDTVKLKSTLENIVSHNYGMHTNCGNWCKAATNTTYTPKLPYGKYLTDLNLKKDLELEITTWTSPETLVKIVDCSSSQAAEQAFSMLSKLAPKDIHLSSSPTLQRRVQYTIAQYNEGVSYGKLLWKKIGIKNGFYRSKAYDRWQKTQLKQKGYKRMEAFKIQRRVLKQQRSMKTKSHKQKESIQYKSGIGLKSIDEKQQVGQKRKRRNNDEILAVKKFKCDFNDCNKSYVNKSGLNQHQKLKHVNK